MGWDAMRSAQVDLTPPTLRILEKPKAVTVQRDATFAVNASKPNVLANVSHLNCHNDYCSSTGIHARRSSPQGARRSALAHRQQLSGRGR